MPNGDVYQRQRHPHVAKEKGDAVLPERFLMPEGRILFKAGREESIAPLAKLANVQYLLKYHGMTAFEFQMEMYM